ncbi:hypothetical protein LTR15_000934 [Elasticomyces elasticus]|nr:hypothetical protein LTR15_000934 [Elasticomyces elasticus]
MLKLVEGRKMGLPASTMGTKSQKPDREATAAYAASQALFSALRSASDEISKQKAHLAKARDIVQTLHVKLVDTTNIDDSEKHDQYMECVVKAWMSATEAYCNIFTELCAITAPDPAVGRAAGRGYEQFKVMERLAATAMYQVKEYPAKQTSGVSAGAKLEPPTALGKRTRDADEVGLAGDQAWDQSTKRQRKRARVKAAGARKNSATGADGGAERKQEVKTEKAKHNSEVKTEIAPEVNVKKESNVKIKREPVSPEQDHFDPEPVSAGKENSVPTVEYEDASGEVAARLKAKEEKRKAKKEAKKRKRDSGDSAVTEPTTTEKPSKKKAKVIEETAPEKAKETPSKAEAAPSSNGGAVKEQQVKRKGDEGTEKGDAGPKKRKKVKA